MPCRSIQVASPRHAIAPRAVIDPRALVVDGRYGGGMNPRSVGLGCLGVAMFLVACSSGGGGGPSQQPASPRDRLVWEVDLDPVAQAVITGGVAVVIVEARDDELDIAGFDVSTGDELWRHPYIPGLYPTGHGIEPVVIGGGDAEYVVFQRPEGDLAAEDWYSPVIAVDPTTGKVLHESPPLVVEEMWGPCADGVDACASGSLDGEIWQRLRFDLSNGTIAVDPVWPEGVREIGEGGLYSTSDRPGERIGRVANGEVLWERPADEVFGDGYGTDGGWVFAYHQGRDLYVGTIGRPLSEALAAQLEAGRPVTVTAPNSQTVAFDASTGEHVWGTPDTQIGCVLSGPTLEPPEAPVRCGFSGEETIRLDADPKYRHIEGYVEGYDFQTGESTWRVGLSPQGARELIEVGRGITVGEDRLIDTSEGLQLLSVTDGTVAPVDDGAAFLCSRLVTFDYALEYGTIAKHRPGGTVAYPCDSAGAELAGDSAKRAVVAGGLGHVDGMVVFAEANHLVGYRIAE